MNRNCVDCRHFMLFDGDWCCSATCEKLVVGAALDEEFDNLMEQKQGCGNYMIGAIWHVVKNEKLTEKHRKQYKGDEK